MFSLSFLVIFACININNVTLFGICLVTFVCIGHCWFRVIQFDLFEDYFPYIFSLYPYNRYRIISLQVFEGSMQYLSFLHIMVLVLQVSLAFKRLSVFSMFLPFRFFCLISLPHFDTIYIFYAISAGYKLALFILVFFVFKTNRNLWE